MGNSTPRASKRNDASCTIGPYDQFNRICRPKPHPRLYSVFIQASHHYSGQQPDIARYRPIVLKQSNHVPQPTNSKAHAPLLLGDVDDPVYSVSMAMMPSGSNFPLAPYLDSTESTSAMDTEARSRLPTYKSRRTLHFNSRHFALV